MKKNFKSVLIAACGLSLMLGSMAYAEAVTENVTESAKTEAASEAATEAVTEAATEIATEKASQAPAADAVSSATESGEGGLNFGDVDLSDDLKKELILEYLKGADSNYREMYQIATCVDNVPTIGSVEFVLDPEDMTFLASSEANTKKLNNMLENPQVDLYWTRQIRPGDVIAEEMPVTPSYFMSYGVEITGTFKAIDWASLDEDEKAVYVAKARGYFETMGAQYKSITDLDDETLFGFLSGSASTFYQIIPSRIVVTSPWFLAPYDLGFARSFVSEEMQTKLMDAVKEKYPDAAKLTNLDSETMHATGLKTQLTLNF